MLHYLFILDARLNELGSEKYFSIHVMLAILSWSCSVSILKLNLVAVTSFTSNIGSGCSSEVANSDISYLNWVIL